MPKPNPAAAEPDTITLRVPIAFRRRGGRKAVTSPDGSSVFAPARARVDSALVKALARGLRWRNLMEASLYATVEEIAAAEKVNASYIGRILRLTLLAPDIVEAILNGRQEPEITLGAVMRPFSEEWTSQRASVSA
ncbi:MAG: hypothetical protein ACHRXM_40365 [Isosphaerales bacterium]